MPTANPSRRARIAALAATADYNPEEAANAQRMLDRIPEVRLDTIAANIKAEFGRGLEVQFTIGRLLEEAFSLLDTGPTHAPGVHGSIKRASEFGRWLDAQNFGFSRSNADKYRQAARREDEVRRFISHHSETSKARKSVESLAYVIDLMNAKPKPPLSVPTDETTPADPAFAALRAARNALLGWDGERPTHNAFTGMFVDDLRESGLIIKALADAYTEARNARG